MTRITLSHGSGGRLTNELIRRVFATSFSNNELLKLEDSAQVPVGGEKIAFTTDSYVVDPIFFAGGDIGRIAVCGTVNDLAVKGAKPIAISAAFIIEEGLEIDVLRDIVASMKKAATQAGVDIVTGDTKVVERGKADKIFITTSGVGLIPKNVELGAEKIRPGDEIILSGPLAEHGMAVMNVRNNLGLDGNIRSDGAPLNKMISSLLAVSKKIRCMKDLTRGGLATALNEIAESCRYSISVDEENIIVKSSVKGACDILGIDPLYVANEGKIIIFAEPGESQKLLSVLKKNKYGKSARTIGRVLDEKDAKVLLRTGMGGFRQVIMLEGEQLPRIC